MGGTYAGSTPAEDLNLALVSAFWLYMGTTVPADLYDAPLSLDPAGRWEIALTSAPSSDHVIFISGFETEVALEIPLAYSDTGGGTYSGGDTVVAATCDDPGMKALVYFPGPTDIMTAFNMGLMGVRAGWLMMGNLFAEASPDYLTDEDVLDLVLDGTCF